MAKKPTKKKNPKASGKAKPVRAKKAAKAPSRRSAGRSAAKRKSVEDLKTTAPEGAPKRKKLARGSLSKPELNKIRGLLIEQRQRIMQAMNSAQKIEIVGGDVGDEADQAGMNIERELQFELSDNGRTTLDQIEGALRKMEKGTFGQCEQCRLPIEIARIKALPFARYCIQCQNTSEKATATLL